MRHLASAALLLTLGIGCSAPPPPGPAPPPAAPLKDDRDDPLVRAALPDTRAVLDGLLAGRYDADPDYAPVARKLRGYRTWSIDRQERDRDHPTAVNFTGTLTGPGGGATFTASMVRQQDGRWMIGSFSGPRPR